MPKEDKHAPAEKVDIDLLENERLTEAKDDDESIDQADVPNKKDEGEKMDSVTTKAEAGTARREKRHAKKTTTTHTHHEAKIKSSPAKHKAPHRMPERAARSEGPKTNSTTMWLFAVLGVVLIVNVYLLYSLMSSVDIKAKEQAQSLKLPVLHMIVLEDEKCTDCFDTTQVIGAVKGARVNITKEDRFDYTSEDGKQVLQQYGITKVPAVIVLGETENLTIGGFQKNGNALIFNEAGAPYTDVTTGKIVGIVDVQYIKADACSECQDLSALIGQLGQAGIKFGEQESIDASSQAGKTVIAKYNITKVPTLVFSAEMGEYSEVRAGWNVLGTVEQDGAFVIRAAQALGIPYYDLQKKEVIGILDVTYITDNSCETCYNVSVHKLILQRFGIKIGKETTVDISEAGGKALLDKYKITKVPTIVLSEDASAYPALQQVWPTVGSVEIDGIFVFRKPEAMTGSLYKDLATGQVLGQAATQQEQQTADTGEVQVN